MIRRPLLWAACAVMAAMAAMMLTYQVRWLLLRSDTPIDLGYYINWNRHFFERPDFYARPERPEYPPASLLLLWPLTAWPVPVTRAVWLGLDGVGLAVLCLFAVRATEARGLAVLFVALIPLSMTPTGTAIGNGQLTLLVLPAVFAAWALARTRPPTLGRDLSIAALLLWSLVKPSLAIPFMSLVLLAARGGLRPLMIAGLAYAACTTVAARFQSPDVVGLVEASVRNGTAIAATARDGNVQFALRLAGLERWMLGATAVLWVAHGAWTWRHKARDPWLLLAVTALVARIWTYHRIYDSVLVVCADIALFRIATRPFNRDALGVAASALLVINVLAFLSPGPRSTLPAPYAFGLEAIQAVMPSVDLVFLAWYAERTMTEGA